MAITWQEVAIGSTTFTARCQHTVSYFSQGKCAIVFGGYNVRTKHLCDVWVLDLSVKSIWQASDYGQFPQARRGHVAHVIGKSLWVFGGACETDCLGDVVRLCLNTWEWKQVRIQSTKIGYRDIDDKSDIFAACSAGGYGWPHTFGTESCSQHSLWRSMACCAWRV